MGSVVFPSGNIRTARAHDGVGVGCCSLASTSVNGTDHQQGSQLNEADHVVEYGIQYGVQARYLGGSIKELYDTFDSDMESRQVPDLSGEA
jgi:hypothetical protein